MRADGVGSWRRRRDTTRMAFLFFICFGCSLIFYWLGPSMPAWARIAVPLAFIAALFGGLVGMGVQWHRVGAIKRRLGGRVCPRCEYDLSNTHFGPDPKCPECGVMFKQGRRGFVQAEERQVPWR